MLVNIKIQWYIFLSSEFSGLLLLVSWLYSWINIWFGNELQGILCFSNLYFISHLYCEIFKAGIHAENTVCQPSNSLKCYKISPYPQKRNFVLFLTGVSKALVISSICVGGDITSQLASVTLVTLKMMPTVSLVSYEELESCCPEIVL